MVTFTMKMWYDLVNHIRELDRKPRREHVYYVDPKVLEAYEKLLAHHKETVWLK